MAKLTAKHDAVTYVGCLTALLAAGLDYQGKSIPTWAFAVFIAHRKMGALGRCFRSFGEHVTFLYEHLEHQATVECAAAIPVENCDLLQIVEEIMDVHA